MCPPRSTSSSATALVTLLERDPAWNNVASSAPPAAAAQATEAQLTELKTGVAEETIAFVPTGEVIVASGDKGGKEATARLRKIDGDYTEQVNADLQQREADEARAVEQKIGDYYAACMDEKLVESRGLEPLRPDLERIAALKDKRSLPALVADLQGADVDVLFGFGVIQDFKDSSRVIATTAQGDKGRGKATGSLRFFDAPIRATQLIESGTTQSASTPAAEPVSKQKAQALAPQQ